MGMRLLGPVEVRAQGQPIDIGRRQQRLTLAILGLELNHHVPVDRLVGLIWPVEPPDKAVRSIHSWISRLRSVLPVEMAIHTRRGGYMLAAAPELVDAQLFRLMVADARRIADPAARMAKLDAALALWRGPALADLSAGEALTHGLEEARLVAVEDRFDAALDAGMRSELVDELTELVHEHPIRERFTGQLMRVLYGSGRQADALALFARLRARLAGELGLDPSPKLAQLHAAILRGEADTPTPPAQAPSRPVPAQLPAGPDAFTGRAAPLADLDALAGQARALMINGAAGVGKTGLAVFWSHRRRHLFPDGQLFLNLQGYGPGAAVRPLEAIGRILRALGVAPEEIPTEVDEAAAHYRSLLAERRCLLLLDNAGDAEQVRPLLPGLGESTILITSRDRLAGLTARDGVRPITLKTLAPQAAELLLARLLGEDRAAAEAEAVGQLAMLCAGLPLALRIAAACVLPGHPIAEHVRRIRAGGLSVLQVGNDDAAAVRSVFDHSYTALKPGARRLFRLLGIVPGADVTAPAAAALIDRSVAETKGLLDVLAGGHLLEEDFIGRYRFHDLLRMYAAELAGREESRADREAAIGRYLDFCWAATDAAATMLCPQGVRYAGLAPDPPGGVVFVEADEARAWLERERATLVAAVKLAASAGHAHRGWALGEALVGFLLRGPFPHDLLEVATAIDQLAADDGQRASAQQALGYAHRNLGRLDEAGAHHRRAYDLANRAHWTVGASAAAVTLGRVSYWSGRLDEAARWSERALAAADSAGHAGVRATAICNFAVVQSDLGGWESAAKLFREAVRLDRAEGNLSGAANSLCGLGHVLYELGSLDEAAAVLRESVDLSRTIGDRYFEMNALDGLANVDCAAGRLHDAAVHVNNALDLAIACADSRSESEIRCTLGAIQLRSGDAQAALEQCTQALRLAQTTGAARCEILAHLGRAEALARLESPEQARHEADRAAEAAGAKQYWPLQQRARQVHALLAKN